MKLILDTHILLWWLKGDKRAAAHWKSLIQNTDNDVLISAASIWEIAIKSSIGKTVVAMEELELKIAESGFQALPVNFAHAVEYSKLPMHHRDPFDRMLVAQSVVEGARLLTHDTHLKSYGAFVLVV